MAYNDTIPVVYKKHETFSVTLSKENYQAYIKNVLKDPKRAENFIATINTAVAMNRNLQQCNPHSIMSAALMGESLNLPYSFGYFYLVPYDITVGQTPEGADIKDKMAQFQMGYKGYVQLAIRSGQYKDIIVSPVKEGELKKYNRITGDIDLEPIEDEDIWEQSKTVGYFARIKTVDGFEKTLYWKYEKMLNHADKYSNAFSKAMYEKYLKSLDGECKLTKYEQKKCSSFWYKNFDDMACKTMLRQLLSKWGLLSVDMQKAYTSDMAIYNEKGESSYLDNPENDFSDIPDSDIENDVETPFQEVDDSLPFEEAADSLETSENAENPEIPDFLK